MHTVATLIQTTCVRKMVQRVSVLFSDIRMNKYRLITS